MMVELMWHSEIVAAEFAARKSTRTWDASWDSMQGARLLPKSDASRASARWVMDKCVSKGHDSVLEHICYAFNVSRVSRALLQELARHRVGMSMTVESTRYTLGKYKMPQDGDDSDQPLEGEHFVVPGLEEFSAAAPGAGEIQLLRDRKDIADAIADMVAEANRYAKIYGADIAKYLLPESATTSLVLTCNARSLRHMFRLRGPRTRALCEFQDLTRRMFDVLPDADKILFEEFFHGTE